MPGVKYTYFSYRFTDVHALHRLRMHPHLRMHKPAHAQMVKLGRDDIVVWERLSLPPLALLVLRTTRCQCYQLPRAGWNQQHFTPDLYPIFSLEHQVFTVHFILQFYHTTTQWGSWADRVWLNESTSVSFNGWGNLNLLLNQHIGHILSWIVLALIKLLLS